jgi:DTW domain-containing protein
MRSVVLKGGARCQQCQLLQRWCICAAQTSIECPLQIDLLTHRRECFRPSSTGNLIHRLFPHSRQHVWSPEQPLREESVQLPARQLWILHPSGSPAPATVDPASVQVVLLDGSWSETSAMARQVTHWGQRISLPLSGESRYWLRSKQEGSRYSTAEALMYLLGSLGLQQAQAALSLQFELHVYASLRARGNVGQAAAFLSNSVLRESMPALLEQLHGSRPQ